MSFENPECALNVILDKFQIDNEVLRMFGRVRVNKRLLDGVMCTDEDGVITITSDRWTLTLNPNGDKEIVKHIVTVPEGVMYPNSPESIAGAIYGNGFCQIIG